ncbi:hypothetical protein G7Y89_g3381 [Cudoniella acicularis]|uniref:Uncharacterized protein n=1 Tax=Cudoniella acicularis TaxID=354080 RepID=A0A8H4RTJ6_9HELO|nr:hypothetical protein G7Y89_g3381 [Cudoniella acicularis]
MAPLEVFPTKQSQLQRAKTTPPLISPYLAKQPTNSPPYPSIPRPPLLQLEKFASAGPNARSKEQEESQRVLRREQLGVLPEPDPDQGGGRELGPGQHERWAKRKQEAREQSVEVHRAGQQ